TKLERPRKGQRRSAARAVPERLRRRPRPGQQRDPRSPRKRGPRRTKPRANQQRSESAGWTIPCDISSGVAPSRRTPVVTSPTVVAQVCLDMLRARKSREEAFEALSDRQGGFEQADDLEQQELVADSVGLALMVVLEKLTPAERLAFVLHDVFDLPFEEIAPIVGRTAATARQLASRARRRVRSQPAVSTTELRRRRQIVAEFLNAVRAGNMDAIAALLDRDVVIRVDASAAPEARPVEAHGSTTVAKGALAFAARIRFAAPMLLLESLWRRPDARDTR